MKQSRSKQQPNQDKSKGRLRCEDCALGTPVTEHYMLDHSGKPICVRCRHSERARIRTEIACEHFKSSAMNG